MKKKIKSKPESKPLTAQEELLNQIYDYGPEEIPGPPPIYRVRLACEVSYPNPELPRFSKVEHHLSQPNRPIPGLYDDYRYGFDDTNGLDEARECLEERIAAWKARMDNSVNVKIHVAKCAKWGNLFFFVEMLQSKWFSGWACPWREYNALRFFIKSLPEYQSEP